MNNKFDKAPSRKAKFEANDGGLRRFPLSLSLTSLLLQFKHAVKLHFKSLAYSMSHQGNRIKLFESIKGHPTKQTNGDEESVVKNLF